MLFAYIKGLGRLFQILLPQWDGLNDVFTQHFLSLKKARVLIMDKWGEIIYEYDGINPKWDGTYKNVPVHEGIYVIQVSAQFLSGKKANLVES